MSRVIAASAVFVGAFLLLTAGTASAAFPGKPGPIAYPKTGSQEVGEGAVEGTGGLYVHGPRVRQRPHLLSDDRNAFDPSYSPNGRLIVFAVSPEERGGGATPGIYVMRNDGSGRRLVTTDGRGGVSPAFFPNGRTIAFSRSAGGHSHIFTIRLDGSGLRQLTRGRHNEYDPVVSPNGRRIAFASDRDRDGRRDRSDIFTMRANGSQLRVAIDGPRIESEPDFSPNGKRIVFASNRFRGAFNVYVSRANGRQVNALTACRGQAIRCPDYEHPAFAPDGRHIVVLDAGRSSSSINVIPVGPRGHVKSFDEAGTEEEGFGSTLGGPTWGPRPR